ncbi:MAG: aminotransferase class V-fold PLP-dependent enzyme [Bacteroidetes bacterium]|nr:aminotransferase class V-fold PLP-dependent enzyme [Bacteroidota bacterium]
MKSNLYRAYLDNAATTPMDERVIEAMTAVMRETFGNPSSTHSFGRNAKGVLETARKKISSLIGAESKEILFTSGGTEADNIAIRSSVRDLGIKHIITSPLEHKAVLSTAEEMDASGDASLHLVRVDNKGHIDYDHLSELATSYPGALISLMHANNEIGTLLDVDRVKEIAAANNCLFHCDTVQTMGHYPIDVKTFGADFLTCSAHKLSGPKGSGFLYIKNGLRIHPMITGGGQERNLRAGTENITGIVGLAKALELAYQELGEELKRISDFKQEMVSLLKTEIPGIEFNGDITANGALYTVLNCALPPTEKNALLLFQLDMAGVCVSGGSACNSGAAKGSHVLNAIGADPDRQAVRFSFGRFTTMADIRHAVDSLKVILKSETVQA